MKATLLQAVRAVEHADSDPSRVALFERVRRRSPAIRLATWIYDRLPHGLSSLLAAGYGTYERAKFMRTPDRPVLAHAVHATYRPALAHLADCTGNEHVAWVRAERPGPRAMLRVLRDARSEWGRRKALGIVQRMNRRHGFLTTTRVAAAIGWYLAGRSVLQRSDVRVVLVSSDYTPESVGLARAARALGGKAVFATHTHPHRLSPPLDFDLTVLDGDAALRDYETIGSVRGEVMFRGVEGAASPLEVHRLRAERPVIGLFLPKEVAWPAVEHVVRSARACFSPQRFLVRWHPNMLAARRLPANVDGSDIEALEPATTLTAAARRCDWVFADQASNVHLGTLRAGTPSIPVQGLSATADTEDYFGFIRRGVLPPAWSGECAPVSDWIVHFEAADWPDRFRRFDASYMGDRAQLERAIGERIRRLAGLD